MGKGLLIYLLFNILALCARYTLVEANCDGSAKQYDRFPDDTDCTKYIECGATEGVFTAKVCPHGTGFYPGNKTCIWRTSTGSSTECFTSETSVATCPLPSVLNVTIPDPVWDEMRQQCVPKWTIVPSSEIRPNCSAEDSDGNAVYKDQFIADPKSCAGYYRCQNKIRIKGSCDETLYNFDPLNQHCALKESLPCSIDGSSPISICEGKNSGEFVVDEKLCTAYFICTGNNQGRQEFCPTGQYFNEGKCDSQRPSRCSCEDWSDSGQDIFPHEDPNKFWICQNGMREETTCPPGTKWNQEEESCEIQRGSKLEILIVS